MLDSETLLKVRQGHLGSVPRRFGIVKGLLYDSRFQAFFMVRQETLP